MNIVIFFVGGGGGWGNSFVSHEFQRKFIFLLILFSCRIGSNVHAVIVSIISLYCYIFDTETTVNPVK